MNSKEERLPIFASRANYVTITQRVNSARRGLRLLKQKYDALEVIVQQLKADRRHIFEDIRPKFKEAYLTVPYCRFNSANLFSVPINEPATADAYVVLHTAKYVGISLPMFNLEIRDGAKRLLTGLGRGGEAVHIARTKFQDLLGQLIGIATLEFSISILLEAQQTTNNRRNGIDYVVLPTLVKTANYISNELEEVDRENFYRLKCSKASQQKHKLQKEEELGKNFNHDVQNYVVENYFDIDEFYEKSTTVRQSVRRSKVLPIEIRKKIPETTQRKKKDPLWEFWTYSSSYLLQVPNSSVSEHKRRHVKRKKNRPETKNALSQTEFEDFIQT